MIEILQQLVNGLSLGAIYALIALGYTMVYGVLRFINFAHADVFMVGAIIACFVGRLVPTETLGGGLLVLVAAMLICALLGIRIERSAYRPLREKTDFNLVVMIGAMLGGIIAVEIISTKTGGVGKSDWFGVALLLAVWAGAESGAALARLTKWRLIFWRTSGGAPPLNALITSIGVSLLLESAFQHPRVFGAAPKHFPSIFPVHNFQLGSLTVSSNQLVVITVAALLIVVLQLVVFRTRMGMAMRAVALNPAAAQLVGVNINAVISFTFALGSALAGAGGVLYALNYPSVEPLMGVMPGLKAFVAAVLGGIGSIPGAALGGLILGTVETLVGGSATLSTYKDAIAFAVLILILLCRPTGLLGRPAAEKV